MIRLALLLAVLTPCAAGAQTQTNITTSANLCADNINVFPHETVWRRPKTGDDDLDRALAICDAHPNPEQNMVPVYPEYDAKTVPWCGAVLDKYAQTETARRIQADVDKEKADRAWLEQYAKGLKP